MYYDILLTNSENHINHFIWRAQAGSETPLPYPAASIPNYIVIEGNTGAGNNNNQS